MITFDAATHTYFKDGDMASISVTELLHKHGLAPNYEWVSEAVLEKARKRGKDVHSDIDMAVKFWGKEYIPETNEGLAFAKWAKKNKACFLQSEYPMVLEYKGLLIGCTVDLFCVCERGRALCDHKTTATFQREYVTWQLSIYDYILRKCGVWEGAEKLICFLYPNGKKFEEKECERVPDSEIEKLLDAELNGEIYKRPTLAVPDEMCLELNAAEETLIFYEKAYKVAKERSDKVREAIRAEMEKQGVFTYETDRVKVTYRNGYERTSIDSTRLKEELPKVYAEYAKKSRVKPAVEIKIKEENGNA